MVAGRFFPVSDNHRLDEKKKKTIGERQTYEGVH